MAVVFSILVIHATLLLADLNADICLYLVAALVFELTAQTVRLTTACLVSPMMLVVSTMVRHVFTC